jgi:tRNA-Thr(GGU) m(6)t(6)A37 methyltransferase TsaA
MTLQPIGVVRSGYKERKSVPRLGGSASVELFPEYLDGLHRWEKHSHLWVLVWLDQAERDILQVVPRGITEPSDANLHGVFSVRSPVRPNPIGMTLAKILGVEGRRIAFDRLDFMDGTPVIDLKPYFLSRDAVFAARNEQIGRPVNREALRESLRMQALNFFGAEDRDLELAVDMFVEFRADLLDYVEPANLRITVPLHRPVLADAFMGMARVTPGKGTLNFASDSAVKIVSEAAEVEFELTAGGYNQKTGPRL